MYVEKISIIEPQVGQIFYSNVGVRGLPWQPSMIVMSKHLLDFLRILYHTEANLSVEISTWEGK